MCRHTPLASYLAIHGQNDCRRSARSEGRSGRGVEMTRNNIWRPSQTGLATGVRALAHELVMKPRAVRLDQAGGRMRKVDRQHEPAGAGGVVEEFAARLRCLLRIPVEDRR